MIQGIIKKLNSGKQPKLIAITVALLMVLAPMIAQAGNPGVLPVNWTAHRRFADAEAGWRNTRRRAKQLQR